MIKQRNVKSESLLSTDSHGCRTNYLTIPELRRLLESAKKGRHGVRDYLLLLMMYLHGLRVSEIIAIRIDDLDLEQSRLWVTRLKSGRSSGQAIQGDELLIIKQYMKTRTDSLPWLFVSERGQPFTRQSINYLIGSAAKRCHLDNVHPHTLRHSFGFHIANQGLDLKLIQDCLGHRDPKHTAYYTRADGSGS